MSRAMRREDSGGSREITGTGVKAIPWLPRTMVAIALARAMWKSDVIR